MRHHGQEDAAPGSGERVRLVECSYEMIGLLGRIGVIEGLVGDEMLVSFREVVVQVQPEMIEQVQES